jgi:hypothetical protein
MVRIETHTRSSLYRSDNRDAYIGLRRAGARLGG